MAGLRPEQLAKSGKEHGEQTALFCWCMLPETQRDYPDAAKLYANYNNAGNTGDAQADRIRGARAKQAGLKSGVADVFLPVARHGKHGLYIELKKKKGGRTSEAQVAFQQQVRADGYGHAVCAGWEEAAAVIEQYLSNPK